MLYHAHFLRSSHGSHSPEEVEPGHMGDYFAEHQAYGQELREALSFCDFVQL